jgi:pimeloyl-ACP methyl ester carboxylesterase
MPDSIQVFTSPEGQSEVLCAYQAVMEKWPAPYEELTIHTSFGETHVIANGPLDGPPIVLLHALLATAMSWYQNVETLSQSYRVYSVDIVGEGNKSRPIKPITSLDDFLQWFTELIDALEIKTLYLVGNSYGGFTGAYYAMKLPDRVRKLILIGPAATIYAMMPFNLHMFLPKGMYMFLPKLPGIKRIMRWSSHWMHKDLPPDPLWEPLFYRLLVYGGLINQVFPRVYTKEEFAQIQSKVLFLFGEKEAIYNNLKSAVRAAQELVPQAEIQMIPDAHHITALSQPHIVNQRMLSFFAPAEQDERRYKENPSGSYVVHHQKTQLGKPSQEAYQ